MKRKQQAHSLGAPLDEHSHVALGPSGAAHLVEVILVLLGLVPVQLDLCGIALLVGALDSDAKVLFTQEQGYILLRACMTVAVQRHLNC